MRLSSYLTNKSMVENEESLSLEWEERAFLIWS